MALVEINKNPTARELRQFSGIFFPLACAVVGGMLWYRWGLSTAAVSLWCAAGAVAVVGLIVPMSIRPLFVGWLYAVFPIGWTVSHLVLAAVYYLLVTPIGLIMTLCGIDAMQRKLDHSAPTYWTPHQAAKETSRYFSQF